MKNWGVRVGGVALVVAAAMLLRSGGRLPETPEDAVNQLFDAATRGDDAAYLRLVCGDFARSLKENRSQLGTQAFRESLRRSSAGIKGLAMTRFVPAQSDQVALDVEIVFVDRQERQRIVCIPQGDGWAIASITVAQMAKSVVPYGTPVFEEPPKEEKRSGMRD